MASSIESDEQAFIRRMFPSPESFILGAFVNLDQNFLRQGDMQMIVQLFNYASPIPGSSSQSLWFGVSQGPDLLPHTVNAIEIEELSIAISEATDQLPGISIDLERAQQATSNSTTAPKIKLFRATVQICSNESQISFTSALESFKCESTKHVTIKPQYDVEESLLHEVLQQPNDFIMDNYSGIQDLTFSGVAFPIASTSLRDSKSSTSA